MVDSPFLVVPDEKFRIADHDPDESGKFRGKEEARGAIEKNLKRLDELQEVLYAQAKYAVLVVFQAMDAGGKDGAIEHIFSGVNPQGCSVTSFKVPGPVEKAHDYLWRYHDAAPTRGMIGIFNRSHYEAVLVERVKDIVPKSVWSKRYKHINDFERMLADENTVVMKFFLNISKDEQKKRLESRIKDAQKHWKFDPADLEERKRWDEYMAAFEDALGKCSTKQAPWYVIPSNKKWFRNWAVSDVIVRTLEGLDLRYPEAPADLQKYEVE